jgi:antirestriction protein ArdC
MTTSSPSRFNVYEAITSQIIAAIETGSGKVQMPWH